MSVGRAINGHVQGPMVGSTVVARRAVGRDCVGAGTVTGRAMATRVNGASGQKPDERALGEHTHNHRVAIWAAQCEMTKRGKT